MYTTVDITGLRIASVYPAKLMIVYEYYYAVMGLIWYIPVESAPPSATGSLRLCSIECPLAAHLTTVKCGVLQDHSFLYTAFFLFFIVAVLKSPKHWIHINHTHTKFVSNSYFHTRGNGMGYARAKRYPYTWARDCERARVSAQRAMRG